MSHHLLFSDTTPAAGEWVCVGGERVSVLVGVCAGECVGAGGKWVGAGGE